jgi:hypothetical protein
LIITSGPLDFKTAIKSSSHTLGTNYGAYIHISYQKPCTLSPNAYDKIIMIKCSCCLENMTFWVLKTAGPVDWNAVIGIGGKCALCIVSGQFKFEEMLENVIIIFFP